MKRSTEEDSVLFLGVLPRWEERVNQTIAIFFGGRSSEHEISVITGLYCANLLRAAQYRVLPVYLPPQGGMLFSEKLSRVEELSKLRDFTLVCLREGRLVPENRPKREIAKIDCALNCCHGGGGEGGVLSALLEWHGVPSASPGMTGSAVFLDKCISKYALKGMGIPVLPAISLREEEWLSAREETARRVGEALGFPAIVKPARLGSSVGISVAHGEEELHRGLALAFRLDGAALIEKYLPAKRDLDLAVYRREGALIFSPAEEVFSNEPILTFGEKYEKAGPRASHIPAEIPEKTLTAMKEALGRVYETFGLTGVVRADFLLSGEELYFNELNTVPGTLATYLFGESLHSAKELLTALIEEGMRPRPAKQTVQSGILKRLPMGGKGKLSR